MVIDTDRSGTHDFLLVIHSNYEPISYRFPDIYDDFGQKKRRKFSYTLCIDRWNSVGLMLVRLKKN